MTAYTANLVDASPDVTLTVTAPDGRVLLVTVALNTTTDHLTHDPAAPAPALVIYLDTDGWEPTPERLRVNVNDGPAFNYPRAPRWYGDDLGHPA